MVILTWNTNKNCVGFFIDTHSRLLFLLVCTENEAHLLIVYWKEAVLALSYSKSDPMKVTTKLRNGENNNKYSIELLEIQSKSCDCTVSHVLSVKSSLAQSVFSLDVQHCWLILYFALHIFSRSCSSGVLGDWQGRWQKGRVADRSEPSNSCLGSLLPRIQQ